MLTLTQLISTSDGLSALSESVLSALTAEAGKTGPVWARPLRVSSTLTVRLDARRPPAENLTIAVNAVRVETILSSGYPTPEQLPAGWPSTFAELAEMSA
jgi:hypothetical protein